MKKIVQITLLFFCLVQLYPASAQWVTPNQLTDLNIWSSQSGFIGWYDTPTNAPLGQTYGSGIQIALSQDSKFGSQIVIPTFDNQIYYRRNQAGNWDSWHKVWSSTNLNNADVDFTCKNLFSNGNLWAKEIRVASTNPWPDYVFNAQYSLPSLSEIQSFIQANHHLPEIPSAQQIKEEGINLGEMNAKLLKKIEELTLFLIQQNHQIDLLKIEVNKIQKSHIQSRKLK